MKKRFFLVGIFTMFLLCCGFLNAATKKRVTVNTNLNETSWKLTEIRKNGRSSRISENTNVTINFSKNKISGSGGINGYSGSYKINRNSTLSATVTSTLMGGSQELMNLEQDFFDILQSNPIIKYNNDTLTLTNKAGDIWTFKNPNTVNQNNKDSLSLSNLNGTSWKLTQIKKNGWNSYISKNTNVTINFSKNKINGSGGINGYSGNYKINRNSILSATVTSTLMAGSLDLMNLEQDFFDTLQSNPIIKYSKDTLTLTNKAGDIWTFKNPNSVNQEDNDSLSLSNLKTKLLNTSWKLVDASDKNMKKILETNEIRVTLNFSEDRIHGDSGINSYFSNYIITSDNIVVGPIGSTKMAGPDNFMKLERQYLNILQNSKKIKLDNNRLTFMTDDGKTLTFKEM
ncbi:META domain-containing protein [Leptotrichia alba]|uniref:META domain-containing protein n=1 Tax=Leptotrichia alba TaxID=3239304 RepID=A0AB39V5Y6_9FUSO